MRKIFVAILVFIIICFSIPFSLTKQFKNIRDSITTNGKNKEENINIPEIVNYNYENHGTVKLLHSKTNEIVQVPIDEYLYGVVSAEMPVDFEMEALKAQAIVARTYTIYKIIQNSDKHEGADICDDSTCCQAWISKEYRLQKWAEHSDEEIAKNPEENWNKIITAIEQTKGKIVTYQGQPINAFFHSNSGGKTEIPLNVWGGSGYPYLQTVETSGEEGYSQYQSEVIIGKNEFLEKIKSKYTEFEIDFLKDDSIKIIEYTDGERIKKIKLGNIEISGVEVRNIFGLKSANFSIKIEGENIKFEVIGYGHGVGMSQTGADSLAKQGKTAEEIVKHFYTDTEITQI